MYIKLTENMNVSLAWQKVTAAFFIGPWGAVKAIWYCITYTLFS